MVGLEAGAARSWVKLNRIGTVPPRRNFGGIAYGRTVVWAAVNRDSTLCAPGHPREECTHANDIGAVDSG